jgi:hypothetical protein
VQQCPTGVLAFGRYDNHRNIIFDKLPASPVLMRENSTAPTESRPESEVIVAR